MKASSTTVDVRSLETLAEKTNQKHCQVEEAVRKASRFDAEAVNCALEAGDLLLMAKEEVGHGHFTKWIAENTLFVRNVAIGGGEKAACSSYPH